MEKGRRFVRAQYRRAGSAVTLTRSCDGVQRSSSAQSPVRNGRLEEHHVVDRPSAAFSATFWPIASPLTSAASLRTGRNRVKRSANQRVPLWVNFNVWRPYCQCSKFARKRQVGGRLTNADAIALAAEVARPAEQSRSGPSAEVDGTRPSMVLSDSLLGSHHIGGMPCPCSLFVIR